MRNNDNFINQKFKSIIDLKGLKVTKISEATGITYHRLHRILSQNAVLSASEMLALCSFLEIDPRDFMYAA